MIIENQISPMPRKSSRLALPKIAGKRSTYAQRTRQHSRAAQTLLAAANDRDGHWTHDDIRHAIMRRQVVELDDLLAELPRAAISHAVAKGWIHKSAGEAWFRVTRRAAADLQLPSRHDGRKIHFLDTSKLPKSLPAFEPAPARAEVSDASAAQILGEILQPRGVLAQARLYRAVMAETGWAGIEIARRLHDDPREITRSWDEIMYHVHLLTLEPEYQNAVASGQLSLPGAYELWRVPAAHRAELYAALQSGKTCSAVRKLARALARPR
jgi:hypothetical protein